MKTFLIIMLLSWMTIGSTPVMARGSHSHHSSTTVLLTTGKGGRVQEEMTPEQNGEAGKQLFLLITGMIASVIIINSFFAPKK